MSIRKKLGQRIISLGIRVHGKFPEQAVSKAETIERIANIPKRPQSAVIEADDTIPTWDEEQSGTVIIAEPDILTQFRREHGHEKV